MNKFKATMKMVGRFVDDNLPTILSVLALGGLGASVGMAVKETPKAMEALEAETHKKLFTSTDDELEKMNAMRVDEEPENYTKLGFDSMATVGRGDEKTDIVLYNRKNVLTTWDKVKAVAPVYLPCAITTIATGACIIASNVVSKKRYLGLAALVATQAKNFDEYQEKVKELFGEKKEENVKKELAKDKMMSCPTDISDQYVVGGPKYPMNFLGCWWIGTKQEVEDAFTAWNRGGMDELMRSGDDVQMYLEDLVYELSQRTGNRFWMPNDSLLNHIAWTVNDGIVEPDFTLAETLDGKPGYVINTSRRPDNFT